MPPRGAVTLMRQRAVISELVRVDDDQGGYGETWQSRGDAVKCQVNQPSAQDRTAAGEEGADLDAVLHFPAETVVERGDQVDVEGSDDVWYVQKVMRPSRAAYVRADCTRRQPTGEV